MLKMTINQEEIEHPILCSECEDPADVLFFERKHDPLHQKFLVLRKKYAKCIQHLTMDENAIPEAS
jgi:hypothetical protein